MHGLKKALMSLAGLALVIMLVLFIYHQPAHAGHAVGGIFSWFGKAGNAFGTFVTTIAS